LVSSYTDIQYSSQGTAQGGPAEVEGQGIAFVTNESCTRIKPAAPPALAGIASRQRTERALFWLMVAGLAWCPFWLGSNDLIA